MCWEMSLARLLLTPQPLAEQSRAGAVPGMLRCAPSPAGEPPGPGLRNHPHQLQNPAEGAPIIPELKRGSSATKSYSSWRPPGVLSGTVESSRTSCCCSEMLVPRKKILEAYAKDTGTYLLRCYSQYHQAINISESRRGAFLAHLATRGGRHTSTPNIC